MAWLWNTLFSTVCCVPTLVYLAHYTYMHPYIDDTHTRDSSYRCAYSAWHICVNSDLKHSRDFLTHCVQSTEPVHR